MDRGEKRRAEDHVEQLIDEALEETFPASDPPSPAVGARSPDSSPAVPVTPSKRS
jgi:hypothetical protein